MQKKRRIERVEQLVILPDRKDRPSWQLWFMYMAAHAATRSSCRYIDAGAAIAAPDHTILSTGYNGMPQGVDPNCLQKGCEKDFAGLTQGEKGGGKCDGTHAEWNAILKAKETHGDLSECTLYSLLLPCYTCAKLTVSAGIREVFYTLEYPETPKPGQLTDAEKTRGLFLKRGVSLNQIDLYRDLRTHFGRLERVLGHNFRPSEILNP